MNFKDIEHPRVNTSSVSELSTRTLNARERTSITQVELHSSEHPRKRLVDLWFNWRASAITPKFNFKSNSRTVNTRVEHPSNPGRTQRTPNTRLMNKVPERFSFLFGSKGLFPPYRGKGVLALYTGASAKQPLRLPDLKDVLINKNS